MFKWLFRSIASLFRFLFKSSLTLLIFFIIFLFLGYVFAPEIGKALMPYGKVAAKVTGMVIGYVAEKGEEVSEKVNMTKVKETVYTVVDNSGE